MLFGGRDDRKPPHNGVTLLRDIVEVVAIVAAGIWAIYVFIYTDEIEPFQKPTAPVVDASIAVAGSRGDLLAVQLHQSIRNSGPATMYVIGSVANVIGTTVGIPDDHHLRTYSDPSSSLTQRFRVGLFERAYSYIYHRTIVLAAGAQWDHQWIIYVPRNRYDALLFDPSFTYTRDANQGAHVVVTHSNRNVPSLTTAGCLAQQVACPQEAGSEIQLSLWR